MLSTRFCSVLTTYLKPSPLKIQFSETPEFQHNPHTQKWPECDTFSSFIQEHKPNTKLSVAIFAIQNKTNVPYALWTLQTYSSSIKICICLHHITYTLLCAVMNFAEMDIIWHPIFFKKCSTWLLDDKKLEMFPNTEGSIFILNWLIKKKLYLLSAPSKSLRNFLSFPTKWILNAAVNIQQSHYISNINLQKHHHVLTGRQENGKQGACPSTFMNANILKTKT